MAQSMKIALTGATGFVGGHIVPFLVENDCRINALVRDPAKLTARPGGLHAVAGDLFDAAALDDLVRGVDAVVHIVGIIIERPGRGQTFERVHVEGTKNLLAAAERAGVKRWVHMSALGTRPDAVSNYHRTKWLAEVAVRQSGCEYTIFRPSLIHGPDGEFMQMVRDFWCKLLPPFVPYFGAGPFGTGGAGMVQPVWVEDVGRCFAAALTNDKTIHETYPMGGPERYTWPDMYRTIKTYLPKARDKRIVGIPAWKAKILARLPGTPFNVDQVIMSQEDSTCDIAKVERRFGFKLKPLEEALAEYGGQM